MNILLIRYGVPKINYSRVDWLKAIEPPLWMSLKFNKLKKENDKVFFFDGEINYNTKYGLKTLADKLKIDKIEIYPHTNHPLTFLAQKEEIEEIAKSLIDKNTQVEIKFNLDFDPTEIENKIEITNYNNYIAPHWASWRQPTRKGYGLLFTSIGNKTNYNYLNLNKFYNKSYTERSLELIEKDIKSLLKQNIQNIKIIDEKFIEDTPRYKEVCELIKKYKSNWNIISYADINSINKETLQLAKDIGVKWIILGIESGNEKIRKVNTVYNKTNQELIEICELIKSYGINIKANYMFGFLDDNTETMRDTLHLATELKCEFNDFYVVCAYPDSNLYQHSLENKWEIPNLYYCYDQHSKHLIPSRTKYLSNEKVLSFRDKAVEKFYSNIDYLNYIEVTFGAKALNDISLIKNNNIKRQLLEREIKSGN